MITIRQFKPNYFYHDTTQTDMYERQLIRNISVQYSVKGVIITPSYHLLEAITKYKKCNVPYQVERSVYDEYADWHKEIKRRLAIQQQKSIDPSLVLVDKFKQPLYPYQCVGIQYLLETKRALLLDQVGLGKTPIYIGVIHFLLQKNLIKDALVLCPAHLKFQIADEFYKFTDIKPIVIDQSQGLPCTYNYWHKFKRNNIQCQGCNQYHVCSTYATTRYAQKRRNILENHEGVIIVNYEIMRIDNEVFTNRKWGIIITDELSRCKGFNRTTKVFNKLQSEYFVGVSATVLENRPEDLWNAMHQVNSDILGTKTNFKQTHIVIEPPYWTVKGYRKLDLLRRKLKPFVLRRTIASLDNLPETPEYQNYFVELLPKQRLLYNAIVNRAKPVMGGWATMQLLGCLTFLREICDHAILVNNTIDESAKLDLLKELLPEITTQCVIFTEWVEMAIILHETLKDSDIIYGMRTKTGQSMSSKAKDTRIHDFQQGKFKFLIASDCIKEGVNLTNAQHLINFDLPWNPAKAQQRIGRLRWHRQHGVQCKVWNFLTLDTVEERVRQVLNEKAQLARDIIGALSILPTTKENLIDLIKNSEN